MAVQTPHNVASRRRSTLLMLILGTTMVLGGCAGGGGGGPSASGGSVLCGTSELDARPCGSGGPAQPTRPEPTVTSTRTERDLLPLATAPVNQDSGPFGAIALQRPAEAESGVFEYQWPGEQALRIEADPATQTYTLVFEQAGQVQTEAFDLDDPDFGFRTRTTTTYSDGETSVSESTDAVIQGLQTGVVPANPAERSTEEIGYLTVLQRTRNVSLGQRVTRQLSWDPVGKVWDTSGYNCYDCFSLDDDYGGTTHLFFAFGNRTAATDLPVSGLASYKIQGEPYERGYNAVATDGVWQPYLIDDMVLTADFGRQMIAASLDRPPEIRQRDGFFGTSDVHFWGIRLRGETTFNQDGFFAIPLAGELMTQDPAVSQQSITLTGRIDGAFFGPGASEIGGVYAITNASQSFRYEGAFAGERE